jgi:HEAT repeat protein
VNEAASAVRWLLQQAEPEARRVAVQQIPKVPGREAADLLKQALGDDDWRVRKDAASTAAALDRRDEVVSMLVATLEEGVNIGLRNAAVEALVAIGPAAVAPTVDVLPRIDADARKLAVEVLGGVPDARGTRALATALCDEDANVRVAAAEALGNASVAGEDSRDAAIEALTATLPGQEDTLLKLAALGSLARLEAVLPWALVEPCARDPLLRRPAIAAAARLQEPQAVRALADATADGSPAVARDAIVALGDLVADAFEQPSLLAVARAALMAGSRRDVLRRAARDAEDTRLRGSAILALGLLREAADIPVLAEALGDDMVAQRADLALRLSGPANLEALLAAVRDAGPSVRAAALSLASTLEGIDVETLRAALRRALADDSPEVMACAIAELGRVGDGADLPALAALVAHADERIVAGASVAAATLAATHADVARAFLFRPGSGKAGEPGSVSAPAPAPSLIACILLAGIASAEQLRSDDVRLLERALAVDDSRVRRAAIDALAQAGGVAAADAVVFALADEERDVQLAALRALGRLGRAEPLAGVVADTRDPVLTASALRALAEADPERALAAARKLVGHVEPAIAASGIEALGALLASPNLAERCEDALFEALDHSDTEVVKLALSMLGGEPSFRAVARVGVCLDHASWEVRRLAAEILSQDKSAAGQEFLRARYERETDGTVRDAIATAVSIRPPSRESSRPRASTRTVPRNGEGG